MSDKDQPADFAAYAGRRANTPIPQSTPQLDPHSVAAMWREVIAERGATLSDPLVTDVAIAIAEAMERLVYSGMAIRQGDEKRGIKPNPGDGFDSTSGQVMIDLVRGLRDAAAAGRDGG